MANPLSLYKMNCLQTREEIEPLSVNPFKRITMLMTVKIMVTLKAFEKHNLCLPLAKSFAGEMAYFVHRTTISSSYICKANSSLS